MKTIYVVGRVLEQLSKGRCWWSFLGAYDKITKAVAACATENDFVGTCGLNMPLGAIGGVTKWPDAFYPLRNREKGDEYCPACGKYLGRVDRFDVCTYCKHPVKKKEKQNDR